MIGEVDQRVNAAIHKRPNDQHTYMMAEVTDW